jgi:signal transduction histidine kinase
MSDSSANFGRSNPQELEIVYEIAQAVARATELESGLEELLHLARQVFIFDNVVIYEPGAGTGLEPTFAKAIGRGRSLEADLAWGESTAADAYAIGHPIIRVEELAGDQTDRTNLRHSLGLAIKHGGLMLGSLVFIRFGGPPYEAEQIKLAECITAFASQLISSRKLKEQVELLESQRRLQGLQDDFIAMVSHELLTPLGFIKGYATTLLREDTNWDEATSREFLTVIDEESDRLRELIENLMDSSRLQAGNLPMTFQKVRVDTFLKDILLRAQSLYHEMSIDLQIVSPGLDILADPTRLAQVFDNLFSNAQKYAPWAPVTISQVYSTQMVRISVQDHGPGIEPEHLEHIFQRFYRLPQSAGSVRGTGLGLFICRKIIRAHNGDILAESAPGKGTTFHIYLPVYLPDYEEQAAATGSGRSL